jgi:polysaccharide deacetylase family protein (PEP-CTERM system associated)
LGFYPGFSSEYMTVTNYLSIDVEDYFQVSAFERICPPESWGSYEYRVQANTERILDHLDEFNVKATFFVLGWIAQRFPELVRGIASRGHEVASHGYAHRRVTSQNRREFSEDIRKSKALLEDLIDRPVLGYRAPSFSISSSSLWAFDELVEAGYIYDSSVFPVRHDLYGIPNWPRFSFCVRRRGDADWAPASGDGGDIRIVEIPITTLRLTGRNIPIAGGGYFRLFPYRLTSWGLHRINRIEKKPFVFYLHPWELDPAQPRINGAGWKSHFRHYLNLDKTEDRFLHLLQEFSFAPLKEGLVDGSLYSLKDSATLLSSGRWSELPYPGGI